MLQEGLRKRAGATTIHGMKNLFFLFIAVVVASSGCRPPAPKEAAKPVVPAVEAPAPAAEVVPGSFTLSRVDGQGEYSLAELRGQPVMLHVFAPWTDSARGVAERLSALEAVGLKILPVVVDRREGAAGADEQVLTAWAGLPAVKASDEFLTAAGGIRALPTTVMLDPDGKVVRSWPGHVAMSNVMADVQAPVGAAN